MNLRKLLLAVGLFLLLLNSYTQEFTLSSNSRSLNELLTTNAKQINTLKGDFVQTKLISSLGMQVESKGNFLYKKQGNKILWKYIAPTQFELVFIDGKFHINQQDNAANSNKQNGLFFELNAILLNSLSGNLSDTKGFNKAYFESNNKFMIQLTPDSSKLSELLLKIEIIFNKSDSSISEVKLFEVGNDITSIAFVNLQSNQTIADAAFQFK